MPGIKKVKLDIEMKLSLTCEVQELPYTFCQNIRSIDPKKVTAGEIEILTCEVKGHLYLLKATVEKSLVKGISWQGAGTQAVYRPSPIFIPFARAAWKAEGVDVDHLDQTPISAEQFITGLQTLMQGQQVKMAPCTIYVRVIKLDEKNILICAYVCGHWIECVHVAVEK